MTKQGGLKPAGRVAAAKLKGLRGWAEARGNRQILQLFLEMTQELRQAASSNTSAAPVPSLAVSKPEKPRKRIAKPRGLAAETAEARPDAELRKEVVKISQSEVDGAAEELDFRHSHPAALISLACMPIFICYRIYSLISPTDSSPLQFSRQLAQQHYNRAKAATPPTEGPAPLSPHGAPQEA